MTVVYLDNYDELKVLKKMSQEDETEGAQQSEGQRQFNEVCDKVGLQRNLGKQLIHAFSGAIQGGDLDGKSGVIKVVQDKLLNFIGISLALMLAPMWKEFPLRHWTGKAAFVAAFKRPLFAVLQEIFEAIELTTRGDVTPSKDVLDEVMVMVTLSAVAETSLRATVSPVISCTDASPTEGGSEVATKFKDQEGEVAELEEIGLTCGECATAWSQRDEPRKYPCPRACGKAFCKLVCLKKHEENCKRKIFFAPRFGERFCGSSTVTAHSQRQLRCQESLSKLHWIGITRNHRGSSSRMKGRQSLKKLRMRAIWRPVTGPPTAGLSLGQEEGQ